MGNSLRKAKISSEKTRTFLVHWVGTLYYFYVLHL
jgi:hypothetical protein